MNLAPRGANLTRAAFTLLELLAVLAIILVLAGTIFSAGYHASLTGRSARNRVELTVLEGALEHYRLAYGDYPRTEDPSRLLQSLLGRYDPAGISIAGGALIDPAKFTTNSTPGPWTDPAAELTDAWGQPYRYAYKTQVPWTNSSYVLYSIGPDGSDSPALLTGGFPDVTSPLNADNQYAGRH